MKSIHRLSVLTKSKNSSEQTHLNPDGFSSSETEHEYFFETESYRAFVRPDGKVIPIKALNYYWEALHIIEREFSVTRDDLVWGVMDLNKHMDMGSLDFEEEFKITLLNQIEDYMEDARIKNDW